MKVLLAAPGIDVNRGAYAYGWHGAHVRVSALGMAMIDELDTGACYHHPQADRALIAPRKDILQLFLDHPDTDLEHAFLQQGEEGGRETCGALGLLDRDYRAGKDYAAAQMLMQARPPLGFLVGTQYGRCKSVVFLEVCQPCPTRDVKRTLMQAGALMTPGWKTNLAELDQAVKDVKEDMETQTPSAIFPFFFGEGFPLFSTAKSGLPFSPTELHLAEEKSLQEEKEKTKSSPREDSINEELNYTPYEKRDGVLVVEGITVTRAATLLFASWTLKVLRSAQVYGLTSILDGFAGPS